MSRETFPNLILGLMKYLERIIEYAFMYLAIELEVFELKVMFYFSVLIHIIAGTYFTWSKLGFSK